MTDYSLLAMPKEILVKFSISPTEAELAVHYAIDWVLNQPFTYEMLMSDGDDKMTARRYLVYEQSSMQGGESKILFNETIANIESAIAEAVAAEKERCAKIVEGWKDWGKPSSPLVEYVIRSVVSTIRAQPEPPKAEEKPQSLTELALELKQALKFPRIHG